MMSTSTASRDELRGLFDVESLPDSFYKVTITPISKEEADEIQFQSLEGIAGRWLDLDEVRKERLGL